MTSNPGAATSGHPARPRAGYYPRPTGDSIEMRRINQRGKRYDFGLGWFTPSAARHTQSPFVEHLGGGAGFFNVMRLYPSLGIGVVVMGNATTYDIDAVARLGLTHTS